MNGAEIEIDLAGIALGFTARRLIKALLGAEPGHVEATYEQISA